MPSRAARGPDLNEACAAGTVDVFLTGDTPGIIGRAAGLPIELVDVDVTEANNYLFTLKDGPQRIEDLAGKRIPVLQGTNQMHFVYGVLASKGILNQVNFINLSSGATEPALIKGDIAAATSAYGPLMVVARLPRPGRGQGLSRAGGQQPDCRLGVFSQGASRLCDRLEPRPGARRDRGHERPSGRLLRVPRQPNQTARCDPPADLSPLALPS